MQITTISSEAFDQDTSRAKKAAADGPVFITDCGTPAYVLLSIEAYRGLTGGSDSIINRLAMLPGAEDIDLDIPRFEDVARTADLT